MKRTYMKALRNIGKFHHFPRSTQYFVRNVQGRHEVVNEQYLSAMIGNCLRKLYKITPLNTIK